MERLKELRTKKGLFQKDIADFLDVERTTYVKYENGAIEPNHEVLKKLADYFEVSVDYLLGRSDTEVISPHLDFTKFFSQGELDLIEAYRAHPEMHEAVQRLLGMDEKQAPADKHDYRLVAFGGDNVNKDDTEPRIT